MEIVFTKHAEEKFDILKRYRVIITRQKIIEILKNPGLRDYSRNPLIITQGILDTSHVLRIVYRTQHSNIIVITFYPGRKSHYEKT